MTVVRLVQRCIEFKPRLTEASVRKACLRRVWPRCPGLPVNMHRMPDSPAKRGRSCAGRNLEACRACVSGMSVERRSVRFGSTAPNEYSPAHDFIVRNSGNVPFTVSSVPALSNGFEIVGNTCAAGLVLAPSEQCLVRLRFHAEGSPGSTRANLLYVIFSHANDGYDRSSTRLYAITAAEGSDLILENGFEWNALDARSCRLRCADRKSSAYRSRGPGQAGLASGSSIDMLAPSVARRGTLVGLKSSRQNALTPKWSGAARLRWNR